MDKDELIEPYKEFLAEEGFRPKSDDDGDLVFKYQGGTYLLILDPEDPEYFRLILPNFWAIESEEEYRSALRASVFATRALKVVKVYIIPSGENVSASIEMFCTDHSSTFPVFIRCLDVLMEGAQKFREIMRAERSENEALDAAIQESLGEASPDGARDEDDEPSA